jgi:hypothetical protein
MRRSTVLACTLVLGGALLALACGGDSGGGPVTPKTLLAIAGDAQSGLTESQLPTPLRVRLLGSDGRRFAGATVTWTVTAGTATLSAVSAVTDDTGSASATVALGIAPGQSTIQAAVVAVPPVTFTETACDYPPITPGTPSSGVLSTTDCRFSDYYTDFYSLDLTSGQQEISLTDSSNTFDAYLELYTFAGEFVAFNNDIDPQVITHSRIDAIVAPGNYLVAPSSDGTLATGPYTVSAVTRAQGLVNCDVVWVTRGVVVTDSVTTNDCGDAVYGYYDFVAIYAKQGSALRIAQRSAAVDAYLELYRLSPQGNLVLLASNDDSVTGNNNAFLAFTVPVGDVHYLTIGTAAPGETGAYELEISSGTTPTQASPAGAFAPRIAPVDPEGRGPRRKSPPLPRTPGLR